MLKNRKYTDLDMDISFLSQGEKLTLKLQGLYAGAGYSRFAAEGLEPYDIYSRNRAFLGSGGIVTVPGARGRLMALKPDVTMSIINNLPVDVHTRRLYYAEKVFRTEPSGAGCREISQAGLEYIGAEAAEAEAEVLSLAWRSLAAVDVGFMLEIGHIGFAASYLESLGFTQEQTDTAFLAMSRRSAPAIDELAASLSPEAARGLRELSTLSGGFVKTLERARGLAVTPEMTAALDDLDRLYARLTERGESDNLLLDFSVGGVMDYYNGLIFKGYLDGVPAAVLSGGRYDPLLRRFGKTQTGLGFAVYLGEIDRAYRDGAAQSDDALTIALPKGRLGEKVSSLLSSVGCDCPDIDGDSRALVFENADRSLRFLMVKPADVPVYVERGAADLGVCGSDVLFEGEYDVYELLDLRIGKCRMACAARDGWTENPSLPLRVATKYPRTASRCYEGKSRRVDIIKLHGSIELAPVLGLSDVIVDIVETGGTLRDNGLHIVEELMPVSARLIANRSGYKFKYRRIQELTARLEAVI